MGWWAMGKHAASKSQLDRTLTVQATLAKPSSDRAPKRAIKIHRSDKPSLDSSECLVELQQPSSADWQIRNSWSDQKRGTSISEEAGTLKISQRASGQNYVWIVNPSLTFLVEKGNEYEVSFDLASNANEIERVEVGFASEMEWSSPLLIQPASPVTFKEVINAPTFSSKSTRIKAAQSKTVSLAFKIKWKCRPENQLVHFIKNIQVCGVNNALSNNPLLVKNDELIPSPIVISPSPAKDELKIKSPCACDMEVEVRDPSGLLVLSEKWMLSELQSIMAMEVSPLSPGIYTLFLKGDGKMWKESFVKL